jgi:ABC-type polysaccharide transport system permease subunit
MQLDIIIIMVNIVYWNKYIDMNGVRFLFKEHNFHEGWFHCNWYKLSTDPQLVSNKSNFIILDNKLAKLFYL